jgi:5-methylcytosine-specific restriction endonuclease McrA
MLLERKGNKCARCGYDKCSRALEFHHTNPNEKDFGISTILTRSIASLKEEVDKCELLCANCHAEEHQRLYEEGYSQFNPDTQHH